MILMLAGLQGIPRELEEAAAIDGADTPPGLPHVTLPLLGPTIRVSVFLSIIGALQLFDMIWVTTGGGPAQRLDHDGHLHVRRASSARRWATAAALAVILFLISLVVALAVPAVRAAPRHRGRPDDVRRLSRWPRPPPAPPRPPGRRRACGSRRPPVAVRDRRLRGAGRGRRWRSSMPIVYAVLGGFRTNGQLRRTRPGSCPTPGSFDNYADVLVGEFAPTFWQQLLQQRGRSRSIAVARDGPVRRRSRRSSSRGSRSAGREALFTLFVLGLLFPAAVAILPLYILVRAARADRQPARRGAAPGGLRAAADDRHPAAVLPEHPDRARGRRRGSTAAAVRVLLAGPAAARPARARDGRACWPSSALERVPAAAAHPRRRRPVDAAAGRHELLDPVPSDAAQVLAFTSSGAGPGARLLRRSRSGSSSAA